ncbi:O-antigen ligase family protein [Chryseobacterium sp. CH21]|uniref:O-antigen ligase family protein n=1 Tax=Chryseobacterium sp. CH21 TaxID=713556 RepID=UPI0013E993BB|nr:O-antigen ligase family protein [Chryseobacterium sp. CH21]
MKLNTLIFNFLLIILGISCLWTIFVFQYFEKSSGIFVSYYISVGHYGLSLLILSIFYYFQSPQKWLKPILGTLIGGFTIFSSSARSPMLAAFIILLILLLYINKIKYWITLLVFASIFIISIYFLKQTFASDFEFVKRMYNAIFEGNGSGRSYYLLKGWNVFKENIPFGGRILFEDGMYPHNIFVEVLMSMGIAGVILFFLYFKDLGKFRIRYIKKIFVIYRFFYFLSNILCWFLLHTVSLRIWSFGALQQ